MMTNNFEKQLDEIRIALYEETKGMTPAERVKKINENGKRIADKYGITITKATESFHVEKVSEALA